MIKKDDKIKDLFASKLNHFEPEVPASAWGEIDRLLSEPPVLVKKDKPAWSRMKTTLIGVAVAASIGLGVFFAFDPDSSFMQEQVAEKEKPQKESTLPDSTDTSVKDQTVIESVETEQVQPDLLAQAKSNQATYVTTTRHITEQPIVQPTEKNEEKAPATDALISNKSDDAPKTIVKKEQDANRKKTAGEKESILLAHKTDDAYPSIVSGPSSSDFSLAVKTNAGVFSETESNRGDPMLFSKEDRSATFMSLLSDENKNYEMVHNQPISVGITVAKSITKQISVETGVTFTYLSSKVKSNSQLGISEKQEFGYLGIPVSVNYNFYQWNDAKFYASLGGTAQKDVYGRYTSNMANIKKLSTMSSAYAANYVTYSEPAYIKKNINQSRWQFSSHLTVGASYPIYRKLNLYTSIGGAYYFDAKNEYKTIYSDRELQLDLNLGLKFDF